ncbi:MAG: bifunctional aspartate kinase/homoserine dehydrogenase I [Ignavibacteriales bacterium]|nr:bifunctional aspartate kinase/homoserine dehydrogenase I [Ignavibacteriales bacterium]
MKVLKFGGSSVGNPERIKNVIDIVIHSYKKNKRVAVIFSAFQGITDSLIKMSNLASKAHDDYCSLFVDLKLRHMDAAKQLISTANQKKAIDVLETALVELENVLYGIFLVKELSPKTLDYVMSFGERLSSFIITQSLIDRKIKTEFLDSRLLVKTDETFGSAKVNFEVTNELIRSYFQKHKSLQVVTGFIGSTSTNETTTIGRGGSDYSASIFGAALSVDEIEIWTDVDGIMTADPRKVKKAFSIPNISFEEAMEMSHFGAKVIHPPTMKPAMEQNIPIRIRNTFNPGFAGTLIGKRNGENKFPIKGISSIDNISLLRIEGSGMTGAAGFGQRILNALAVGKINVMMITMASSQYSLCLAVLPKFASTAKKLIDDELKYEIRDGMVEEVFIENNLSIIAVVGENMRNATGLSGRVFQSLGKNGINIVSIAQGSSELNISVVIPKEDEAKALNAIHDAFFLSEYKSINLFVVGTGLIGRTLFKQIQNQLDFLSNELFIDLKIMAIANSRKMLFDSRGLSIKDWDERLSNSTEQMNLNEFVSRMTELNLPNSIFVDCTSSEQLLTKYLEILQSSISIVTPNKKANSSNYEFYLKLKQAAHKHNVKFLYETNVGAGLPIISTLQDLVTSGDKIIKIEGILSGTLSYIFNSFNGSKPFSKILKEAQEKGFTEPDPRDDLNGLDVARKLLILVREAGYQLELNDIQIENLIPLNCRKKSSLEEFYKSLEKNDSWFEDRREKASLEGKSLRYIAKYEKGSAVVSLQSVDSNHPFFSISGNDNIVAFKTVYYNERPIVIAGPGAGAEVTSGGIFADIIRIGNYLI